MMHVASRQARFALLLLTVTAVSACSTRERGADPGRARQTMRFEVVAVGYSSWERWEKATTLDVREYACAVGDSFGGGRPPNCCADDGPFVFVAIANESTARVRYPSCLAVLIGWSCAPLPMDSRARSGPDTLAVTTDWSHFGTHATDGGCLYSVRVMRRSHDGREP